MTLHTLLAPVSADAPCGDNLEYHPDYMQMMRLARGKEEQQFGDTLIPAQEPDWRQVEQMALGLLADSKDLRIMLLLAQAWTARRGISGYADGLSLIGEALERYWQELWPSLSPEGEPDPFMRINILRELGDGFTLARLVLQAPFLRADGGCLSLADAAGCLAQEGMEYPGGAERLREHIRQDRSPQARHAVSALAAAERLQEALCRRLGESAPPEMSALLGALRILADAAAPEQRAYPAADEPSPAPGAESAENRPGPSGEILTRQQAYQALEQVKKYFQRVEPGHPAPLLIDRAQRLMDCEFMDIIRNLAPAAAGQLEALFGADKAP